MKIVWTDQSKADLERLYVFLAPENTVAAVNALLSIHASTEMLMEFPAIGESVEAYAPREVRRWVAGVYELHYERIEQMIFILSVWHQREIRLH